MVRFIIPAACKSAALLCNLHSNMVRFIISKKTIIKNIGGRIYIPIWLDLLYFSLLV